MCSDTREDLFVGLMGDLGKYTEMELLEYVSVVGDEMVLMRVWGTMIKERCKCTPSPLRGFGGREVQ